MRVRSAPAIVAGTLLAMVALISVAFVMQDAVRTRPAKGDDPPTAVPTSPTSRNTPSALASAVASITPVTDPRQAEAIPIYPGAEDVVITPSGYLNQPDEIEFRSDDSVDAISEFYVAALTKMGWTDGGCWRDKETGDVCLYFGWPGPTGSMPYQLQSSFLIMKKYISDPNGDVHDPYNWVDRRWVRIELLRKPYASRVPLYAEAQIVQSTDTPYGNWPIYVTRETTYVTAATVQEIRDFYSTTLPELGWVLETPSVPDSAADAELQVSDRTTPFQEIQPVVVIRLSALKNGHTKVTIIAEGWDLKAPNSP
jgi:hypothetical protein